MPSRTTLSHFVASSLAVALLSGCASSTLEDNSIRPQWLPYQEFHLETRYKTVPMKTERGDATADPNAEDLGHTSDEADAWTEAVYWRYQVIHQGFSPEPGDDFYEYAVKGGTESAITVIKASLDPVMNPSRDLSHADPKIYMVIRDDRLRMAGLVYFYTVEGERLSQAITVDDGDMNKAYNLLSQSNLAVIPHFVPPFPISREDRDVVLEDGQEVSFTNATDTGIDVVYENNLDGTLISECWEDGQPWAVASSTPNMESRLMDPSEVDALSGPLGRSFAEEEDDEDIDFVARLREAVNLDDALYLDGLVGNHTFEVHESYRPWAGSWWPQSKGALIFGHLTSTEDALSELNQAAFEEPATIVQTVGEELRNLRKNGEDDSEEWDTKLEEYRTANNALRDELKAFTNSLRSGIDGGGITLEDGRLVAGEGWNGNDDDPMPAFDLDINELPPMEKFALLQHFNDRGQGNNPWDILSWEMMNHWSPAGSSWWGHCNGWSAAAILFDEPRESLTVSFGPDSEHAMELSSADQKGLLSESNYSGLSNFYGARYNGDEDEDISDLSPRGVLQLLGTYIGQRGVPLVFDTSADEEVWNFPAWAYEIQLTETTDSETEEAEDHTEGDSDTGDLVNINTAGVDELMTLDGIDRRKAERIVRHREMNGPFQTTDEITKVEDIDWDGNWFRDALWDRLKDLITVEIASTTRSYEGSVKVRFATDSVEYDHVDTDPTQPEGFTKDWAFTLEANAEGKLISGTWLNEDSGHPDFAWVPYSNTERAGRSENPYLPYADLQDYLPGLLRR